MNEMSTKFQLTADNYYSDEANREYLSVSQFKDFVGTYGRMGCEEMALAKIRGEYKTEPSNARHVLMTEWGEILTLFKRRSIYKWQ